MRSTCSAPCGTPSAWLNTTTATVLHTNTTGHKELRLGFKRWRDPSKRRAFFVPACSALGVRCEFMPTGNRWLIPMLVQQLGFNGTSAEVGVFKGQFSLEIMRHYRSGGKHLLVDAWANFNASCSPSLKRLKAN